MDSPLKVTPHFDGKLGTARADVDAVSDEFADQPAVNALSVQDLQTHHCNFSQGHIAYLSLKSQNEMLKQLVEEVQKERDEALSSVERLRRWLHQTRRDARLDVHCLDLEMTAETGTTDLVENGRIVEFGVLIRQNLALVYFATTPNKRSGRPNYSLDHNSVGANLKFLLRYFHPSRLSRS